MTRPGQRARVARECWSGRWVVLNSPRQPEGSARSIAQDLGDVGHDGLDVLVGQLALVGVVDLDLGLDSTSGP